MNKNRNCNIIYQENEVILGKMMFYSNKVVIESIQAIIECKSPEDAEQKGDEMIKEGLYDSYLVPSLYKDDIISLQK